MKRVLCGLILMASIALFTSALQDGSSPYVRHNLEAFKADAKAFAAAASRLRAAVSLLAPGDNQSRADAIAALRECRLSYKRIEAVMEYYFEYPVNLYNRAPVYEVEEPYMEYQAPVGLQYIESLLLESDAAANRKELLDQCDVVVSGASDIPATLYGLKITDAGLLEADRLELIRISTLGITGYDAPGLKSGLAESSAALQAMRHSLTPALTAYPGSSADSITRYLQAAQNDLDSAPDFDRFDRLRFLTKAMLPLQEALSAFIHANRLDTNTHPALNHTARHIFSPDAISAAAFSKRIQSTEYPDELTALGAALFSEKALSRDQSRSCASCHKPALAFTDGLVKSKTLDGKNVVLRNAPSLFYTAYQHAQFYDGRAASLEDQILAVLQSPLEMDVHPDTVVKRLNRIPRYQAAFRRLWPGFETASLAQIASALVAFEHSLAPFNSSFDRYIAGDTGAMKAAQKRGFNLFMGKARCGTCHFAPVFNGLLPPFYDRSELEVIGVPQRDARGRRRADSDSGRYRFFPISFNNGAFKTISIRNAARTAPYMHNGVFRTLEQVLDFYNRGGGRGIGLVVPAQTLSDNPLGLTRRETADIIAFLGSLNDHLPADPAQPADR